MFTTFLMKDTTQPPSPKEGDLYKTVTIAGKTFELYYGYYEDFERHAEDSEPMPIYPDFKKNPSYTDDGAPFVTAMQDPCEHYEGRKKGDSCLECKHFKACKELFGLCTCESNQRSPNTEKTVQNE